MSPLIYLLSLLALLALSATCSGTETAYYSLSRLRLEAAVGAGKRWARLVSELSANEASLIITLLVANTLVLELLADLTKTQVERWVPVPAQWHELLATVWLIPMVILFGEFLPKDAGHRRPMGFLSITTWPVVVLKIALAPLVWPLRGLSRGLELVLGLKTHELERAFARDFVVEMLAEGKKTGALSPRAELLARNVLALRAVPLTQVMVPWSEVERAPAAEDPARLRERLAKTAYTRLPIVDAGGRVLGYVHQLEVLGDAEGGGVEPHLRKLEALPAATTVDRALARLRMFGQRMALVGTPEQPLGIVTLKDLLETISGDLARW